MMLKKFSGARVGATVFGVALFAAAGTAVAVADEELIGDSDVEINVEVTDRYPSGVLALSVAGDETSLTEQDSGDPEVREFTGTLPTVTVTDTRTDVPDVPWYVLGTASDFVSGSDSITAEHLGWIPTLAGEYGDDVQPGEDVYSVVDDATSTGLSDGELLYVNWDQAASYEQGAWSAFADLHLKVDAAATKAGTYTSVLTLSLFE